MSLMYCLVQAAGSICLLFDYASLRRFFFQAITWLNQPECVHGRHEPDACLRGRKSACKLESDYCKRRGNGMNLSVYYLVHINRPNVVGICLFWKAYVLLVLEEKTTHYLKVGMMVA